MSAALDRILGRLLVIAAALVGAAIVIELAGKILWRVGGLA